jgi:hypothetical protein
MKRATPPADRGRSQGRGARFVRSILPSNLRLWGNFKVGLHSGVSNLIITGPGRTQAAPGATKKSREWLDKGSTGQAGNRNSGDSEEHHGREEMQGGKAEGVIVFHAER